ncbi:hypothetical protein T10_5053 [Trichinella papuae]|uniref:Uncharacterized protein n=1 Tax=Trichinella papuae TaxID=268474 RepID=A0A0V1LZS3_9BILA|nr:hypothetical protein T10_5053 [Trichinella papuae]
MASQQYLLKLISRVHHISYLSITCISLVRVHIE